MLEVVSVSLRVETDGVAASVALAVKARPATPLADGTVAEALSLKARVRIQ